MNNISVISSRGQITLPARLRKLLDLSSGTKVILSYTDGSLTIKPLPNSTNVMSLYGSVKTVSKKTDLDQIESQTKKYIATKTANQSYE